MMSEPVSDRAVRGVRNLSKMTVGRIATQVVLATSALVIPRVLGAETFGRYAALMAVVAILEAMSSGGLHLTEIRYFGPMWHDGDRAEAITLGSTLWTARLVLAVAASGAAVVWIGTTPSLATGTALVLAVGALVAVRAALEATRHLFLSLDRIGRFVGFEALRAVATLLVVVTLFATVGFTRMFGALAAAQALLLAGAVVALRRVAPLSPARARWHVLRPLVPFSLGTLLGIVAWITQAHLAVYAVANWVSLRDAAIVGITVQIYVMAQTLLISPWSAVTPILAEFDASGRHDRLREWAGVIIRWGAAAAVVATTAWSVVGDEILQLLPSEFASAHVSGTVVMAAVVILGGAVAINNVLYVGRRSGTASTNLVLFAVVTVLGTILVVRSDPANIAIAIAWVYVFAGGLYFAAAYATVVWRRRMWLPLRRTILLALPVLAAWPLVSWDPGLAIELLVLAIFLAAYWVYAVAFGLLPRQELASIRAAAGAARRS